MRLLSDKERLTLRLKILGGLQKLGVDADPNKPIILRDCDKGYLLDQVVDGLHALGRSAEVTPKLVERESRWMVDELRAAGITFMASAWPPDPYVASLDALRANAPRFNTVPPRQGWPCGCGCKNELRLDANGIPDPYARTLEKMKKEQR